MSVSLSGDPGGKDIAGAWPTACDGTAAASSRDRVLVPGRAHAGGTEQGYANYVTIARFLNGLRWQESPSNVL